jgi:hypothetical protein
MFYLIIQEKNSKVAVDILNFTYHQSLTKYKNERTLKDNLEYVEVVEKFKIKTIINKSRN